MEIFSLIISLVGIFILFVLAFMILRWSLKWVRRLVVFIISIFLILLCDEILILNIFPPLINKYLNLKIFERPYIISVIIILGCGIISSILPLIKNLGKKSQDLNNLVKNAKTDNDEKFYLCKKANEDAWYFSLYSIIVFIIYLIVQASILDITPMISSKLVSISNSSKLWVISFFLCTGTIILILVNYSRIAIFRFYGRIIVITNTAAMIFLTLFLHDSWINKFPSIQKNYFSNLAIINSPIADTTLILILYFHCLNISAFLSYGYDSGLAWLLEDEKDEYRPNSMIKVGTHWSQRLVRWLLKQIAKMFAKNEEGQMIWIDNFKKKRMPESILHWHSVLGGTIGAYAGHRFFNHKKIFVLNKSLASKSAIKFAPVFERIFFCQVFLLGIIFYIGRYL
ncbi:MAG: DUF1294 domain-containing protein [Microcystis sp. M158S2]|nr:DUF1294 domain-containing protein [Microcystis sp. M158S2]